MKIQNNPIRSLIMVTMCMLWFIPDAFAQVRHTAEYNGATIEAGTIVVVFDKDNSRYKSAGHGFDARVAADRMKPLFGARVTDTFESGHVEKWSVAADLNSTLDALNRIPGVRAFPNFIIQHSMQRPSNPVELFMNDEASKSVNPYQIVPHEPSIGTVRTTPFSNQRRAILNPRDAVISDDDDDEDEVSVLYFQDFNDPDSIDFEIDHVRGTAWNLIQVGVTEDDQADMAFVTGALDELYASNTLTFVDSPVWDLSQIEEGSSLFLTFDYASVVEPDFDFFRIVLTVNGETIGSIDLSRIDAQPREALINISSIVGAESFSFYFVFLSDESAEIGFGAWFDNVAIILGDISNEPQLPTNDLLLALQYALHNDGTFHTRLSNPMGEAVAGADISAFDAWTVETGSRDVVIAIMDDGVDFAHPDLAANAWVNPQPFIDEFHADFNGWSPAYRDNRNMFPGSFHGTHVAGSVGAVGNNGIGVSGVAQDVSLMNVMIFDEDYNADSFSILLGFEYITRKLEQGINIVAVNHSWGGGLFPRNPSSARFLSVLTDYALEHASYGTAWIVSSGNRGLDLDELRYYDFPAWIPAPNVINVSNTDYTENISPSSDYGRYSVDIGAPGTDIASTFPGNRYALLTGTSMSSPHVSGALALIASQEAFTREDFYARLVKLMAGADRIDSYQPFWGEGARLNAYAMVDPAGAGLSGLVPSHQVLFLEKFIVPDQFASRTAGFVNVTNEPVQVHSVTFTGSGAQNFFAARTDDPSYDADSPWAETIQPGGAFGVGIYYVNRDGNNSARASVVFSTSAGDVTIQLDARVRPYSIVTVSPSFEDAGSVAIGTNIERTFNVANAGIGSLNYRMSNILIQEDSIGSELFSRHVNFNSVQQSTNKPPNLVNQDNQVNDVNVLVGRALEGRNRSFATLRGADNGNAEDSDLLYSQDFNNPDVVENEWEFLAFGSGTAANATWELVQKPGFEEGDLGLLVGDLAAGYLNNTIAVAVSPIFNFSELPAGSGPSILSFDYIIDAEEFFDFFIINVIVNGIPNSTIANSRSNLVQDGNWYRASVDISNFAGFDDVEFWFIFRSDESVVDGFGAMFDNVAISTDELPIYYSSAKGTIEPGASEDITVNVRTDMLPTGDYLLITIVNNDAFNAFIENSIHGLAFSSYYVRVDAAPEFADAGAFNRNEDITFGFDLVNTGLVEADFQAFSVLQYMNGSWKDGDDLDDLVKARAKRVQTERDGEAPGFDRHAVSQRLSTRIDASLLQRSMGKSMVTSRRSSVVPRVVDELLFYENFSGGELPDGWTILDQSLRLGSTFSIAQVSGINMLYVGEPEHGVILHHTDVIAFSPIIDLSGLDAGSNLFFEFDYAISMEQGYDFASVWVGYIDDEGDEFYVLLGSSEDLLVNDGMLYSTMIDLSFMIGKSDVFLAFYVETDDSFYSDYAFFGNIAVYSLTDEDPIVEDLITVSPDSGSLDVGSSTTMTVTINPRGLYPGMYAASTFILAGDTEGFDSFLASQHTIIELENNAPVAVNDTIAVMAGDVVPVSFLMDAMLENDFDPDGDMIFIEDVSDPLYGSFRRLSVQNWNDVYNLAYVAPLNFEGVDRFEYMVSDGEDYATATVYIHVMHKPAFMTGATQQIVVLEDHTITLSTVRMAAGVGGMDSDVVVWAESHSDDVVIEHDFQKHTITIKPAEYFWGSVMATFYVGHMDAPVDSMEVNIVVVPVNNLPEALAAFEILGDVEDGLQVAFTDLSNDDLDPEGGIVAWLWDFGDGNTSREQNPIHVYRASGTYDASLTVMDTAGATDTFEFQVVVIVLSVDVGELPTSFAMHQNYPNPFNPTTTIRFDLPVDSHVTLRVYDALGQLITTLVNDTRPAGSHTVQFQAQNLSSGIYLYRIEAGSYSAVRSLTLIK